MQRHMFGKLLRLHRNLPRRLSRMWGRLQGLLGMRKFLLYWLRLCV